MPAYPSVYCLQKQTHAEVYLCVDPRTRQRVVVKQVAGCVSMEAAVAAKLQTLAGHPHVVPFFEVQRQQDTASLVMEYCPHGDLLTRLQDDRLSEDVALYLFRQVLLGVEFLHKHGIAHRDISLENLLIAEDHKIKICDFGLATLDTVSLSTETVGKKSYMAPEVAAGRPYDPIKADLWSLGIVLFVLLTGSPLFARADASDGSFRAFRDLGVAGVLRLWRRDAMVSTSTKELLSRLLAIDPNERCASTSKAISMIDGKYEL